MKPNKILALFFYSFAVLSLFNCNNRSRSITAMTYNIRYDSPYDGDNIWQNRKEGLVNLLNEHQPDIIGTQEGQNHQLDYIKSRLKSYKMIGGDRDNSGESEYSSIFYNTNTLNLINTETFWLSETPTIPSLGWDASYKRICTYGMFELKKSKEQFFVFNTHLDHMGEQARLQSTILINKKIKKINRDNLPVMLMGDFNCEPNSNPIKTTTTLLNDGLALSKLIDPIGTFSGFDLNATLNKRIDYIFVDKFKVESYLHINSKLPNGNWPSDHLPVLTKLKIEN